MVDLFNFDEVDDGHRDVDVDRDVEVLHLVKAERRNLLVVVVLLSKWGYRNLGCPYFQRNTVCFQKEKRNLKLSLFSRKFREILCCPCFHGGSEKGLTSVTFIKRSLQLSSSDSSRQFDVWSHLVTSFNQDHLDVQAASS